MANLLVSVMGAFPQGRFGYLAVCASRRTVNQRVALRQEQAAGMGSGRRAPVLAAGDRLQLGKGIFPSLDRCGIAFCS
jgi:hypothetical protein